jgi:hypothetical protein
MSRINVRLVFIFQIKNHEILVQSIDFDKMVQYTSIYPISIDFSITGTDSFHSTEKFKFKEERKFFTIPQPQIIINYFS